MIKKRLSFISLLLFALLFVPVSARAQVSQLSPATGIPNDNGSSTLQNTRSGLQPNNSLSTQPQAQSDLLLGNPTTTNLQVVGTNSSGLTLQNTTASNSSNTSQATTDAETSTNVLLWIIVALLGIGFLAVCTWQFMKPKRYS